MTEEKLNPKIKEVTIGNRKIRTVKMYPLSLGDQFKMTKIIQKGLSSITDATDDEDNYDLQHLNTPVGSIDTGDVNIIQSFISIIQENIETVIGLVFDSEDKVSPDEITNDQLAEIADNIFEVNYRNALGNFSNLFEKVKSLLPSKRLSPQSVEDIPDTELKISTENHSKMEE